MTSVTRALQKPKLLFEVTLERRPYRRRFLFLIIVILAAVLAWVALQQAKARPDLQIDMRALEVGSLAAGVIILLASIRAVIMLVRWRSRPNEHLRFFDQGFSWTRGDEKFQYRWEKLQTFRESGRGIYTKKRPLLQWGAHTLVMSDKRVFKLQPRHGDLRQIARSIRPYAAEVTGIRMGRRLREEKPVRVHPRLTVWPGGLQVGKEELPWKALNVFVKGERLIVQTNLNGKVRIVRRIPTYQVDNLGGFMELATSTIKNHR